MGYGDEILATGLARLIKLENEDSQVVIGDEKRQIGTISEIFLGNPYISHPQKLIKEKKIIWVNHSKFFRPYINYKETTDKKFAWNPSHRAIPGNLFFSKDEKEKARNNLITILKKWNEKYQTKPKKIIFFENSQRVSKFDLQKDRDKALFRRNNHLPNEKVIKLINSLKEYLFIQSVHEDSFLINCENVFHYKSNFRAACAMINISDLFFGPEGGFPQAAAALNKKAVVIFGGWINPLVIGYDFHHNIYVDIDGSPCGSREICQHCKDCMKKIDLSNLKNMIINS
jgi:ADP-heptose:LPS heptosyltransferase